MEESIRLKRVKERYDGSVTHCLYLIVCAINLSQLLQSLFCAKYAVREFFFKFSAWWSKTFA